MHLRSCYFQEQIVVVVTRPACNVRRNDAEITPGPAILPSTQTYCQLGERLFFTAKPVANII